MDRNTFKKEGSGGRVRGHSLLSTLKGMDHEQAVGNEQQRAHPGITFKRMLLPTRQEVGLLTFAIEEESSSQGTDTFTDDDTFKEAGKFLRVCC
jgi:hypothetical protein